MADVTADRRLYLDADGALVEEGDPGATSLWCNEGDVITDADAEAFGYKPKRSSRRSKSKSKPANKSRKAPAEDKSAD